MSMFKACFLAVILGSVSFTGVTLASPNVLKANGDSAFVYSYGPNSFLYVQVFSNSRKYVNNQVGSFSKSYIYISYWSSTKSYFFGGEIPEGALKANQESVSVDMDTCNAAAAYAPNCGPISLKWKSNGQYSRDSNGIDRIQYPHLKLQIVGSQSSRSADVSGTVIGETIDSSTGFGKGDIRSYRETEIRLTSNASPK